MTASSPAPEFQEDPVTTAPLSATRSTDMQNKFSLVVITAQRARQLENGARPRVDPDGHKYPWIARREVMAGMISWNVTPKPGQAPSPR